MFVASSRTVRLAHEIDPAIRVGMMLAYRPLYTYTCDPADNIKAMEMQQSRYFYSDVQMRGFYPEYRLKKYEREGIVLQDTQEDYEVLKQYPCDFLSFPAMVAIQLLCMKMAWVQQAEISLWE